MTNAEARPSGDRIAEGTAAKAPRAGRLRVLATASTFPRWSGDSEPPFVLELYQALADEVEAHVLAPWAPGTRLRENLGGVRIYRYGYGASLLGSLSYQGGMFENLRRAPWKLLLLPGFALGQAFALRRLIARLSPDLVHAHWLLPQGLIAAAVLRHVREPPPLVITCHGAGVYSLRRPPFTQMKRWTLRRAREIAVVGSEMKSLCMEELGAPEGALTVQPMGVDLRGEFAPAPSGPHPGRLVYVGRLVERKGVHLLLEAFSRLVRLHDGLELVVLGDGPWRAKLERQAQRLRLGARVRFEGGVPKPVVAAWLRTAEVAVFPAVKPESFGLTRVEAMGCGAIVVAADWPSTREILEHERTGVIVRPGDAETLAETLAGIFSMPARRRREIGLRARSAAVERYDWSRVADRYLRSFERAADRARSPATPRGD